MPVWRKDLNNLRTAVGRICSAAMPLCRKDLKYLHTAESGKEILHTGSVEMLQVLSTNTAVPSGLLRAARGRNYQQDACKKASGALRAKGLRRMAFRKDLNYLPTAVVDFACLCRGPMKTQDRSPKSHLNPLQMKRTAES